MAGIDKVQSAMLRDASHSNLVELMELIKECLASCRVPSALQTGKRTLIDKKAPSLEVKNKHPLSVSSAILSIITKLLQKRMDAVC